jgi:hypothetical protein
MEEKLDPTFSRRFIVPLLLIFAAGAVCGGLAMLWATANGSAAKGVLPFCIIFLLMWAALLVLHSRVLKNYQCPQCGARLPRYQAEPERLKEYRFSCAPCNIIWQTGLRQGDSD